MSGGLHSLSSHPDFSPRGSPRLPPRSPKIYASETADPVPPPLPPRPPVLDRTTTTDADSLRDRLPQLSLVDNEVTEAELRQDYEDQEIERFLALFSAVTEVRASGGLSKPSQASGSRDAQGPDGIPQDEDESATSDTKTPRASKITSVDSKSLSEKIASEYVLPFLPPARPPPQPFSFGRLRVTAQRLYQTFDGDYLPLIFAMQRLAAWEEYNTSLNYCIAYWALWLFDLLPATFFTLILFTLLKRRLRPYPSLQELRARHAEMARADKFGIAVQNTLLKPSSFQAKDMWRLYRMLPSDKRKRSGKNGSLPDAPENVQPASEDSTPAVQIETPDGGSVPVLDEELDSVLTEQDLRTVGTQILSDIADFHERCHNLYLWKKPRSSLSVSAVLLFLALFFALLPARYVAKVIFFALGFVFWHVIPVIIALGPDGRVRLPPFLDAVPTDAEVALDMISQRVVQGLPVLPQRNSFFKLKSPGSASPSSPSPSRDNASAGSPYTDWTKWGERAATGKEWARGARRIVTRSNSERVEVGNADTTTGAKTYPAQHKRGPGLITITPTTIYFTLLSSSIPSLIIPLGDITSIRKGGILKGMSISWNRKDDNGLVVEEAEDVFRWIGGRDEVFARLLGSDGRKWLQA